LINAFSLYTSMDQSGFPVFNIDILDHGLL